MIAGSCVKLVGDGGEFGAMALDALRFAAQQEGQKAGRGDYGQRSGGGKREGRDEIEQGEGSVGGEHQTEKDHLADAGYFRGQRVAEVGETAARDEQPIGVRDSAVEAAAQDILEMLLDGPS